MSVETITEVIAIREQKVADTKANIERLEAELAEAKAYHAAAVEALHQAKLQSSFRDQRGDLIEVGDEVCVTYIDPDAGAQMWMHRGTVVGFARTRVVIQFPSREGTSNVSPRCLRVIG